MDEKEIIKSQIRKLSEILITAKLSYETWWIMAGPDRPKYIEIFNTYLSFFRPTINAHYHTLIISLYKLYDKRRNTTNFNHLVKIAKSNWPTSDKDFSYLEEMYQQALTIWKKIRIMRHEFYAHQASNANISDIYKRAEICPDQFKELIDLSIQILNEVYSTFDRITISMYSISASHDTYRVLDKLSNF